MSLIPQDFIQELLGRTDIVDVVGKSVQLKKAGTNYKGLCPFHSEKSPSFTVSPSKQFYHCFGCGAHGTAIGFLMENQGLSFPEAVRELASHAGLNVPQAPQDPQQEQAARERRSLKDSLQQALEQANHFYREQLRSSPRAIDYLKGRGLTGRIAAHYGLGYAPDAWQGLEKVFPNYDADILVQAGLVVARDAAGNTIEPTALAGQPVERRWDRLRDRITFPIRNASGELIGFGGRVLGSGEPKYLNSPETLLFHKGEELYGLHEARAVIQRSGYCLVVEGYLDVIALAQHGVGNAVATLGTACTGEHVKKLFRHCAQIVFSFDGDNAGRKAAARALEAALPALSDERSVKFLFLPPEHDPDSFVREFGADAFEREVGRAQPLSLFLIDQVGDGLALTTAEGRAQAVARARPLLALLPESTLKNQIQGELAQRLQTSADQLRPPTPAAAPAAPQSAVAPTAPASGGRRPAAPRAPGHLQRPRADHALTALRILLAQPQLWQILSSAQHELLLADPGSATLCGWLERQLDNHPDLAAAALWEALRADGLQQEADALVGATQAWGASMLEADTEALSADLRGALDALELDWIKQRQQELAARGLIEVHERIEYQNLVARLRELTRILPRL